MTTNQGFYTDTDWAFTFTLSEAMAGTFEFSVLPQPGMPSVLDLSYVAASPVTVIPLSVAVDDHAAVKPGLYRVHGTCTAAGGGISWTCEGALKVGRPGDEETYLTIDGTSSGAVSVDVTNAAAYAQAAEESATAAAASEATATTKAAEATASATAAAGSATTATTKAAEAATSATAAAGSSTTATTKAAEASTSATAAEDSATAAEDAKTAAQAAQGAAETARDDAEQYAADAAAVATAGGYFPAATGNVPRGATGAGAITAGSGGTNGTFALAFSGGNFAVNPVGTFTVAGGALTAVTITSPGLYVGASPTAPTLSFAASTGLTGAACALTVDFLVQAGQYYWTDHATDTTLAALYRRNGAAAEASSPLVTLAKGDLLTGLLGTVALGRATPAAATNWSGVGTYYLSPDDLVSPADGYLSTITLYSPASGQLTVQTVVQWDDAGTTKYRVTGTKTFSVGSGTITVQPNMPWAAGEKLMLRNTGGWHYGGSSADPGARFTASPITSDAAGTAVTGYNTTYVLQAGVVWSAAFRGEADTTAGIVAMLGEGGMKDVALAHAVDTGCWRLLEDGTTGEHRAYTSFSFESGATYTAEFLVPIGSSVWLYSNAAGFQFDAVFDGASGTLIPGGTGWTTTDQLSVEPVGDFRRLRITRTATATATSNFQIRLYRLAFGGYLGDNTSQALVRDVKFTRAGCPANLIAADISTSAWTKNGLQTVAAVDAPVRTLSQIAAEAGGAAAVHRLAGRKVTMVGTSLVAQNIMPSAFESKTGCILQRVGESGGALGLDARPSPHYGSGTITAALPTINADAEAIILDMLVNDIAASDVPLGSVSDTTTATYYGALANFFTWCKTNRPNALVWAVVPTSASLSYSPSDYHHGVPNANGNTVEDFQIATRRACLYHGRGAIDPNSYGIGFADSGADTGDGLHWDASGGERVATIYAKITNDLCEAAGFGG